MPDLKMDKTAEKPRSYKEMPPIGQANVNELPQAKIEREKIKDLAAAGGTAIEEIAQTKIGWAAATPAMGGIAAPQAAQQKQIESVLASGLEDIYLSLAPDKQKEFKRVGEETAGKINKLLAKAKINIGEIIKLIKKWLALIPGVNKYFLEQEAKIKADEIIKMKQASK